MLLSKTQQHKENSERTREALSGCVTVVLLFLVGEDNASDLNHVTSIKCCVADLAAINFNAAKAAHADNAVTAVRFNDFCLNSFNKQAFNRYISTWNFADDGFLLNQLNFNFTATLQDAEDHGLATAFEFFLHFLHLFGVNEHGHFTATTAAS